LENWEFSTLDWGKKKGVVARWKIVGLKEESVGKRTEKSGEDFKG